MESRNVLVVLVLVSALAACSQQPSASGKASADRVATETDTSSEQGAGARIFNGNCVPCHQQNGVGIPGVYPSLAGSPIVLGDPAELARWVIKGQRPRSMPAGRYSTQMLQFGWMKPADAAALFSYLRSNFGNSAPPVDVAMVTKALD